MISGRTKCSRPAERDYVLRFRRWSRSAGRKLFDGVGTELHSVSISFPAPTLLKSRETLPRRFEPGIDAQGLPVGRKSFGLPSRLFKRHTQVEMRVEIIGLEAHGRPEVHNCLFEFPFTGLFYQSEAEHEMGLGKVRVRIDGIAVSGQCFIEVTPFLKLETQRVIGLGVFRISLYGIAIKRLRVLKEFSIVKTVSEVKKQASVFLIFDQTRLVPGDVVVGDG